MDYVTADEAGKLAVMDEVVVHVHTHSTKVKENPDVRPCADGSTADVLKAP